MKMMIRGEMIKYGACKKKARDNLLEVLQNKLYQMTVDSEQKYPNSLFRDHEARIILLNKDIQQLIEKITQAASKKNQANWHAYGGKNSRYFFSLENKFPKKPITRMKVGGKTTSDGEEILGELEKYYKDLFSMKLQTMIF